MNRISVLDHGFVRLVSYIQPAEDAGFTQPGLGDMHRDWTGDLEIIRNARVSHDADWRTGEDESKDDRLMNRLLWHRHTTPQEAMVFTFEVKAPIFVFRQWHRHRTWTYNEVSARYTELPEEFYIPKPEHIGAQGTHDKQVRDMTENVKSEHEVFVERLAKANAYAYGEYKMALANEIPRELARMILPVNIYSRMFATVDLHNLFHFLDLRLDEHAQYEIRVYAQALLDLIRPIVPVAVSKWEKLPKRLTEQELDAVGDLIDDALEHPETIPEHFKAILESAARKLFPNR